MEEIWVPALGFESTHEVSNLGKIRNISKYNNRIITQRKTNDGYFYVEICVNYKRGTKKVHRIVAESFHGMQINKCVNHIDGNKENNYINNLEWVSTRENMAHRSLMKKKTSKYTNITWDKKKLKWRAQVYIDGKQIYIGLYENEDEAYQKLCLFLYDKGIINKYV